jgi:uncharacterized protein (DUF2237 family)
MTERNVLGGELQQCGTEPMTGFFRDGCCHTQGSDQVMHTICAIVTDEFLAHQSAIGNDLQTPHPELGFAGLHPGDPWCVTMHNWARAHQDGVAAPVVLAATNEAVLRLIPLDVLRQYAVDVPADLRDLED